MFKKLLSILLILSFSVLVFALDDQGNPNDPNESERANACYEGGSMEGKCLTDWDWEAGWYLIRFEYGLISRDDFPKQYNIVLPALPEPETTSNTIYVGCKPVLGNFVNFGNSSFVPASVPTFSDSNCSTPTGLTTGSVPFVWTTTLSSAMAICNAHGFAGVGTVNPGQLYHCS